MRALTCAVAMLVSPVAVVAIPVSFSGVLGSNAPATDFTGPDLPFAVSFDAPTTLSRIPVYQQVQYTIGAATTAQTAGLSAFDNGDGTDTLDVVVIERYLGIDYRLTAPIFIVGNALASGSYSTVDARGMANIATAPSTVPFTIRRISPLLIGDAAAVPEPATWVLLSVGFGLTGAAVRRSKRPAPQV